jgi:predicted membrane-bound dolichyl-phosphate-mannose-protein mannosyltransferase
VRYIDVFTGIVFVIFAIPVVACLGFVAWILFSVLYLGASSCPANSCL